MIRVLVLFLSLVIGAFAKLPQLSEKDVRGKIDEILRSHACHSALTPELAGRVLNNFLDELDPTKTYFLASEVSSWTDARETELQRVIGAFKGHDFGVFSEIHKVFVGAIERRGKLEEKVGREELPQGVKSEEFKDMTWAGSEEELLTRLVRIKALQSDATAKLENGGQAKFWLRLQKRRLNKEAESLGEDAGKVVLSTALKAAASALDAHTNYFTPSEANQFMIQVQQRLFGIGAQLRDDLDGLLVMRIVDNSPASSGKIKMGDKIIAVDGEPVVGLEINEAVELIRGEQGTKVNLTLIRDEKTLDVELTRGEIVMEEARLEAHTEAFGDGVVAVCKLFTFYQDPKNSSALDLRRALEEIKKEEKLKGVVLDLRGNGGGLLSQAVAVSGLFINKGIVVSVKDNGGKLQHLREVEGKPVWDGPLFVLVNRASASAAEIVAQSLQDYGRAIVVGDRETYGKGSFQTFTLDPTTNPKVNPQGEYKVTRGRYYTVSGKSPQLVGVASDIVIPGILSELEIGEKFAKFPLENDQIDPHFDDDLSDLTPFHRIQLGPLYKYNLQQPVTTYHSYVEPLSKNSAKRIAKNKLYQKFIAAMSSKNFEEAEDPSDLQLHEALNAMKDLIFLMENKSGLAS